MDALFARRVERVATVCKDEVEVTEEPADPEVRDESRCYHCMRASAL